MGKFKPLFDIPLAQYDTLDEYPPSDEVKRALEAHLVNHHADIPKKPTVGKSAPSQDQPASANANVVKPSNNKKRKRNGNESKPANQDTSTEKPQCPHCDYPHVGDCWFKYPEKMPQAVRERLEKKRKSLDKVLKGNAGQ